MTIYMLTLGNLIKAAMYSKLCYSTLVCSKIFNSTLERDFCCTFY